MPKPQSPRRYWVIAPYFYEWPEQWKRVWEYDLVHGIISIGWAQFGPLAAISKDRNKLLAHIKSIEPDSAKALHICSVLHPLYQSVSVGDIVIARRGRKEIAAIGEVTRKAHYNPNKSKVLVELNDPMPHHLGVKWHDSPRNIVFDRQQFGMQALHEIESAKFSELVAGANEIENQEGFLEEGFLEGEKRASTTTVRNAKLRAAAKRYWGLRCYCCDFDFEEFYGSIGMGIGIVHHLTTFGGSSAGPVKTKVEDTRVVCANCHQVIHVKNPPIDVEVLKERLAAK